LIRVANEYERDISRNKSSKKTMKVLVTDGGKHTLAIVRRLGKAGIEVAVIASKGALPFYSKYCKRCFICPSPHDENKYIDFLEEILKKQIYVLLIPVGFKTTQITSKNRARLSSWIKLEVADEEKIEIALNKKRTYEIARSIGIPYPETIYPESFQNLGKLSATIRYPVVIKGLQEAGKNVVAYANNRDELLQNFLRLCEENNLTEGNLPMLQQYIQGHGYGFFALYQHGVCKRVFMHKRIREFPVTGGASTCAQSFYDTRLRNYGMHLLDALKWHGVAMVEFKKDQRDGEYKLMEINPKFWGSLDLAIAAGVNFPYYLVQMAMGEDLKYSEDYCRDIKLHWPFNGDIQHVLKNTSSTLPFLFDFVNPPVKSNIVLEDLKPNLMELHSFLVTLVPESIKKCLKRF